MIALVHMGIYPSAKRGSIRLAREVPGIDLIVDGHSHTRLDAPLVIQSGPGRQTIIVQAWKWGLVLGRIDLRIQKGKIIDYLFEAIPINLKRVEIGPHGKKTYRYIDRKIEEDQTLLSKLTPYVNRVQAVLSEVIGKAEGPFFQRGAREMETALGDIIADSMKWYVRHMDVDFAIQNGGGIRAPLAEGDITKSSIYEILPFDNTVVVLTLKGTDVQDLFHHIAMVSRGSGAFPQVSDGVRFRIDREARRCEDIRINGKPVDLKRTYRIATNSYMANGGDGYRIFLKAVERYDASMFQRDVFIQYIKHLGGPIRPEIHHRIQLEVDSNPPKPHALIRLTNPAYGGISYSAAPPLEKENFYAVKVDITSVSAGLEGDRTGHSILDFSNHPAGHKVSARPGQ